MLLVFTRFFSLIRDARFLHVPRHIPKKQREEFFRRKKSKAQNETTKKCAKRELNAH